MLPSLIYSDSPQQAFELVWCFLGLLGAFASYVMAIRW